MPRPHERQQHSLPEPGCEISLQPDLSAASHPVARQVVREEHVLGGGEGRVREVSPAHPPGQLHQLPRQEEEMS